MAFLKVNFLSVVSSKYVIYLYTFLFLYTTWGLNVGHFVGLVVVSFLGAACSGLSVQVCYRFLGCVFVVQFWFVFWDTFYVDGVCSIVYIFSLKSKLHMNGSPILLITTQARAVHMFVKW